MMTDRQKRSVRLFSGVIRLVVGVFSVAWLIYLLVNIQWGRGGQFVLGSLVVAVIPLVLSCALLPDGIRQVFGKASK